MPRTNVVGRVNILPSQVALNFDGVNGLVALGTSGSIAQATPAFSAFCRFRREKMTGITAMIGDGTNTAQNHWNFQIQGPGRKLLTTIVTSSGAKALVGANNIPMFTWCNGLLVYDGASIIWYLNGDFDSTTTHTGTVTASTDGVFIGTGSAPIGGAFRYYGGQICDVKYWTRALSSSEAYDLGKLGRNDSSIRTGLTGEWLLNDRSGTTALDSVGSNHGTISGGASFTTIQYPSQLRIKETSTPGEISGCIAYYEADQGITLDGSNKVSQWNDLSGFSAHMTQSDSSVRFGYTASNINGKPTVDMTSAILNKMTATISFPATSQHSLVVLVKANATQPTSFSGILCLGSGAAGGSTSSIGTDNGRRLWTGGAGDGTPTFSIPVTGQTYLLAKTSDKSHVTTYIDNVFMGTVKQLVNYAISPLNLGVLGQYTAGSTSSNMSIAFAAIYNRQISITEMNAIARYANEKYGTAYSTGSRTTVSGRINIT